MVFSRCRCTGAMWRAGTLEQSRAEREGRREGAEEETEGGRLARRVFHHDYNRVTRRKKLSQAVFLCLFFLMRLLSVFT